jgi:D-alanyl-D-alanine carboxypeptidase (penicillin-binding protein 5/6)
MTHTTYRSPYGDGGEDTDTTTSPHDLLHLAWTDMHNPVFRKYVSTEIYDGHVTQTDGKPRVIRWTNTNELLKVEGYDGVKTGTTDLAGRCLVSSCHRDGDHLMCCVLGAPTEEERYIDTQNLLRWAWLKRGHKPDIQLGTDKSKGVE